MLFFPARLQQTQQYSLDKNLTILCTVVLWFIVRRQKIAEGFGCIISIETMELVWKEDLHHKTMKTLIIYQHKISTCVKFKVSVIKQNYLYFPHFGLQFTKNFLKLLPVFSFHILLRNTNKSTINYYQSEIFHIMDKI